MNREIILPTLCDYCLKNKHLWIEYFESLDNVKKFCSFECERKWRKRQELPYLKEKIIAEIKILYKRLKQCKNELKELNEVKL